MRLTALPRVSKRHRQFRELKAKHLIRPTDQKPCAIPVTSAHAAKELATISGVGVRGEAKEVGHLIVN
jgi:hypothetical protein